MVQASQMSQQSSVRAQTYAPFFDARPHRLLSLARSRRIRSCNVAGSSHRESNRLVTRPSSIPPQCALDRDVGVRAVEAAFARADHAAANVLIGVIAPNDPETAARLDVVRARIARHENDVDTWYAAARRAAQSGASSETALLARTLQATAARRSGRTDELARVAPSVLATQPGRSGFASYLIALEAYHGGQYDRALAIVERSLAAGADVPSMLALRGWIDDDHERFERAAANFEAAVAALDRSGTVNELLRARIAWVLVTIAVETLDLALGRRARVVVASVRWTSGLRNERVGTLVALRDLALLEGRLDEAWLLAREATGVASEGPAAVVAETGAALMDGIIGDARGARLQLERAYRLLRAHRWRSATADEAVALASFAAVAAPSMPREARRALALHRLLRGVRPPSNVENDRRRQAIELTAEARIAHALERDDRTAVRRRFELALGVWRDIGYGLRVAQLAGELFALTGDLDHARTFERLLERAPHAWLRAAIGRTDDPRAKLSKSERRVFDELLHGGSAKAIGEKLGRSPHTVSNHTRKIFSAFGVSSRARLVARCVELGIGPAN